MSLEQEQFEQRFARIREIEALGARPYGQRFDFTHTVPQVWAEYGAKTAEELDAARVPVRIPGRILTIRRMGKAGFMHLQQGGAKYTWDGQAAFGMIERSSHESLTSIG